MKLLCFQAKQFRWKTHAKTIRDMPDQDAKEVVTDAVVAFVHAEIADSDEQRHDSILRQTVKHLRWLANKRNLKNIVVHSFTHLGAETAPADFAASFIENLARRLREHGYQVWITPFGYLCEWDLSVYGESLAKVWKEIH